MNLQIDSFARCVDYLLSNKVSKQNQMTLLKHDASLIQYIENQTDEMKWFVVNDYPEYFKFIKNPSKELMKFAVKAFETNICYVDLNNDLFSKELMWISVKNHLDAVLHIKFGNYDKEFEMDIASYAVRRGWWCISGLLKLMKHHDMSKLKKIAIEQNGMLIEEFSDDKELWKLAIQSNSYAIQFIDFDRDLAMEAVKNNGLSLKFILRRNRDYESDDELIETALQENGLAIKYVYYQTEQMQRIAVINNINSSKYIKQPSFAIMKLIAENGGHIIDFKQKVSKERWLELVKIAIDADPNIIYSIKYDITDELKERAIKKKPKIIMALINPSKSMQTIASTSKYTTLNYINDPVEETLNTLTCIDALKYVNYARLSAEGKVNFKKKFTNFKNQLC